VPLIDLSDEEVALIVEALHEAAFFRDARSNLRLPGVPAVAGISAGLAGRDGLRGAGTPDGR
jgi:hypothetical protein